MIDAALDLRQRQGAGGASARRYLDAERRGTRAPRRATRGSSSCGTRASTGSRCASRFTYRGDSLWWFAELYLHKQQVILRSSVRLPRSRPRSTREAAADAALRPRPALDARRRFADRRGPRLGSRGAADAGRSAAMTARRARRARHALNAAALASRLRGRGGARGRHRRRSAAFVHRAFWRPDRRTAAPSPTSVRCWPRSKRRARSRRRPPTSASARRRTSARAAGGIRCAAAATATPRCPIERYAPLAALARVARSSGATRHDCAARSGERRPARARDASAAAIAGRSCARSWPASRCCSGRGRRGRWTKRAPRSTRCARASRSPTRKLAAGDARSCSKCRRRGIPTAGLQHGFIYRHWLNYLHEPDEMKPIRAAARPRLPAPDADAAVRRVRGAAPRATRDDSRRGARGHRQPAPRRARRRRARLLADADDARARAAAAGRTRTIDRARDDQVQEARRVLPALLEAAAALPGVQLVIKTHPAETRRRRTRPLAAGTAARHACSTPPAPLAPLLRAAVPSSR